MVSLPGLISEFCRLGWRHWPVSDPGQCIWTWSPSQIDLGPASSSRTWLVIWILSCNWLPLAEHLCSLVLALWDPCQWDFCLPCYYAQLLTSLSLQGSLLLLLPDKELLTIFYNRYVNGIWRKNNAKYKRSLTNIYLEWTQSSWQLGTE